MLLLLITKPMFLFVVGTEFLAFSGYTTVSVSLDRLHSLAPPYPSPLCTHLTQLIVPRLELLLLLLLLVVSLFLTHLLSGPGTKSGTLTLPLVRTHTMFASHKWYMHHPGRADIEE